MRVKIKSQSLSCSPLCPGIVNMLLGLCRQTPPGNTSTHRSKWMNQLVMACMNVLGSLLSLTHCVLYVHDTHKVSWGMGEGLILLLEALH